MSCPTCNHTMKKVGIIPPIFWCPRCGTILDSQLHEEPMLVERIIAFLILLTEDEKYYNGDNFHDLIAEFDRLGIRESVFQDGAK